MRLFEPTSIPKLDVAKMRQRRLPLDYQPANVPCLCSERPACGSILKPEMLIQSKLVLCSSLPVSFVSIWRTTHLQV